MDAVFGTHNVDVPHDPMHVRWPLELDMWFLAVVVIGEQCGCDEQVKTASWCRNQETKTSMRAMVATTEFHDCRERMPHRFLVCVLIVT